MGKHNIVRFNRLNTVNITDEYRTDEPVPHTLGYVDHHGNGTVDVTVQDPYTDHSRLYTGRPTSKGLAIMSRHVEKMGYTFCGDFKDLTAE